MGNDDPTSNDKGNGDGFYHDELDRFIDSITDGSLPRGREFSPLENALIEMSAFSAPEVEVGGSSVVERMSEEIGVSGPGLGNRRTYVARFLGTKAIIALATAAAFTGASAAAASGSLPQPIQKVFSAAVSNLGVSFPSSPPTTMPSASKSRGAQDQSSSVSQVSTTTTGLTGVALGPPTTVLRGDTSKTTSTAANCAPLINEVLNAPLLSSALSSTSTTTSPTTTTTEAPTTTTTSPTTTTTSPTTTTTQQAGTSTTQTATASVSGSVSAGAGS